MAHITCPIGLIPGVAQPQGEALGIALVHAPGENDFAVPVSHDGQESWIAAKERVWSLLALLAKKLHRNTRITAVSP